MKASSFFSGATPTLRVMALLAHALVLMGWLYFFRCGEGAWLASMLGAFVLGISSLCPLGGIATLLSLVSLAAVFIMGVLAQGG